MIIKIHIFLVENFWIYALFGFMIIGGIAIITYYTYCYRVKKLTRPIDHLPSSKVGIKKAMLNVPLFTYIKIILT